MTSIVTTNNSTVLRHLGTPAFSRLRVSSHVAVDAQEALELVRSLRPAVALLDVELPGESGYEVCARLKADPALEETRVVLLLEGAITPEVIDRLGQSGCDEVLVTPMTGEVLLHKVAQLLGLPRRIRRRMSVSLQVDVRAGGQATLGRVVDLSPDGARIILEQAVGRKAVTVRMSTGEGETPLAIQAEVVWEAEDAEGVQCGVEFKNLDLAARTALQDLSLWESSVEPDGSRLVTFQGDFREHTRFGRLASRLVGRVVFDLAYVRYLNSAGVRHWVEFLRSLKQVSEYRFVRCSVAFVSQASMVPESLGTGVIESFMVPYACDGCDLEEERLMQTPAFAVPGIWPPELPVFRCPRCGDDLAFDDIPARYFAFLESDQRIQALR